MDLKPGNSIKSLLHNAHLQEVMSQICQLPTPDQRINSLNHLLTLIKADGAAGLKTLCERYAPNYNFSCVQGGTLVLNCDLLVKQLQAGDFACLTALRQSGCEAFDTRTG